MCTLVATCVILQSLECTLDAYRTQSVMSANCQYGTISEHKELLQVRS